MHRLPIRGGTAVVEDTGHGAPVVLIHGSAGSRLQWTRLTARLSTCYRVLAPDLTGYGGTSWPAVDDGTVADDDVALLRDLLAWIDEPVRLVGHSYGACVAAIVARQMPEHVTRLVLIEPAAFHLLRRTGDETWPEIRDVAHAHMEAAWKADFAGCAHRLMRYWIGADAWTALSPDRAERVVNAMHKVALEWVAAFELDDDPEDYAQLAMPTLLICGTDTTRAARRVVELLHAAIAGSERGDVVGAGHLAPFTHADTVNLAIERHLNRGTAGTGRNGGTPIYGRRDNQSVAASADNGFA